MRRPVALPSFNCRRKPAGDVRCFFSLLTVDQKMKNTTSRTLSLIELANISLCLCEADGGCPVVHFHEWPWRKSGKDGRCGDLPTGRLNGEREGLARARARNRVGRHIHLPCDQIQRLKANSSGVDWPIANSISGLHFQPRV